MKHLLLCSAILMASAHFSQQLTSESSTTTIAEQSSEGTWQRARIFYKNNENLALLSAQGIALDHGTKKVGVYIESDFTENQLAVARMIGCDVEVLIEDVKAFYKERGSAENLKPKSLEEKNASCTGGGGSVPTYSTPTNWELGSMGGFYTYNEMLAELDDMASQYPNLITVKAPISTFQTHEGRSIYWVKISDNPNTDEAEPEMLYDAIHHAREPAAMQQLIYYMWYLLENYATSTEVQGIVDNTELYFIPVLNPDGYQYNCDQDPNGGGMYRKNRKPIGSGQYGVDNNRNYDYDNGSGSVWGTTGISMQVSTGNDTYPGTGPFTEVENLAMKWFCENHDLRLALNNHAWDNSLLYPHGYQNVQTPENSTYVAISDMMVQYNGLGMVPKLSATLYPASGDSDDWQYGDDLATKPRIFSFTPEIGDDGFWPDINDIEDVCNSMVWTNLTAAHLITNYSKTENASDYSVTATSGYFNYTIQRLGLEDPANFTVSVNPISANILSVGGSNNHSAMTMLQTDLDSVSFNLDPAITDGEIIEYEIVIDNGYFTEVVAVEKVYGTGTIAFADPADDVSNWTVSQTWGTTTQDYYSASSSITDSPSGDYSSGINKRITLSNGVDLSIALSATVSYYAKWDIEDNYDYVQFEVSTDGGSTWEPQCGNYTNTGTGDQDSGNPLYDGTQNSWVKEEINLSEYIGETVLFRFQIISDNYVEGDGFYFDDFEVSVINETSQSINESDLELNGYPNPASDMFTVTYSETISDNANLIIMNSVGEVIRIERLNSASGRVDLNITEFPSGVYFYQIKDGERSSTMKKLVISK